jgi:CheY-like chemotaxis protein
MNLADFQLLLLENRSSGMLPLAAAAEQAGLGVRLRTVRDSGEALDLLTRTPAPFLPSRPPVLLIDLEAADAFPLLDELQKSPRLRSIVTIGLTPQPANGLLERAYRLGINSCLARPTTPEEAVAMVHGIVRYWKAVNVGPRN